MSPSKKRSKSSKGDDGESEVMDQVEEQSEAKKREVRSRLRQIKETMMKLQMEGSEKDPERLREIMEDAKNVISEVKGTQEAIEDAKMFSILCKIVRDFSEDTSTNEKKFLVSDYSSNLARFVNAETDKDKFRFSRVNLIHLGEKMSHHFKRAPTLKFVLGTLNTEVGEVKERRKAVPRARDKFAAATKTAIVEKSQATEAKTDRFVKLTKKCLEEAYSKNKREPICYFRFVIDPNSFGKTVENMFHVSFLVKQRAAILAIGENGLPTLEPVTGRRGEEQEAELKSDQAVINISLADWTELKKNLNVVSKSINIE